MKNNNKIIKNNNINKLTPMRTVQVKLANKRLQIITGSVAIKNAKVFIKNNNHNSIGYYPHKNIHVAGKSRLNSTHNR